MSERPERDPGQLEPSLTRFAPLRRGPRMAPLGPVGGLHLQLLGMSLAVAYLLVLPPGWPGFAWALVSAAIVCFGVSREVLGVFFIWLAPPIMGQFALTFGIPHLGGGLSVALGLVLLLCFGSAAPIVRMRWRAPILWLLWTLGVLVLAYFRGPESEYSRSKLAYFALFLPLAVLAFSFLVGSKFVDLWALGMLSIVGSVLFYSVMACSIPQFLPSSIWTPCGVRLPSVYGDEIQPPTLMLSSLAGVGIALLLCGSANTHLSRRLFTFLTLVAFGAGMLVINSGGERKWMVIIPVVSVCAMLGKPRSVTLPATVLVLSCVALAAFVVAGLLHENPYLTTPFDTQRTVLSRLNRDTDWTTAVRRLEERPLLGHGLGGYDPRADRDYAHNLLLELLCETGVVGTVLIVAPLAVFFLIPRRKQLWAFTTRNGAHLLPLLVAIAALSMTRSDLTMSYQLFALLAVMWMYPTPRGEAARRSPAPQKVASARG